MDWGFSSQEIDDGAMVCSDVGPDVVLEAGTPGVKHLLSLRPGSVLPPLVL